MNKPRHGAHTAVRPIPGKKPGFTSTPIICCSLWPCHKNPVWHRQSRTHSSILLRAEEVSKSDAICRAWGCCSGLHFPRRIRSRPENPHHLIPPCGTMKPLKKRCSWVSVFLPGLFGESLFFSSLASVKTGYTFQSSGLQTTLLALFEAGMPMCLGKVCLWCFQGSESQSTLFHDELSWWAGQGPRLFLSSHPECVTLKLPKVHKC